MNKKFIGLIMSSISYVLFSAQEPNTNAEQKTVKLSKKAKDRYLVGLVQSCFSHGVSHSPQQQYSILHEQLHLALYRGDTAGARHIKKQIEDMDKQRAAAWEKQKQEAEQKSKQVALLKQLQHAGMVDDKKAMEAVLEKMAEPTAKM